MRTPLATALVLVITCTMARTCNATMPPYPPYPVGIPLVEHHSVPIKRTIGYGKASGFKERALFALADQANWKRVWDKHVANQHTHPALPAVDFKTEMVIAIFFRPGSGGGSIVKVAMLERNNKPELVRVYYSESKHSSTAEQLFHIVVIKQAKMPAQFYRLNDKRKSGGQYSFE